MMQEILIHGWCAKVQSDKGYPRPENCDDRDCYALAFILVVNFSMIKLTP